MTAWKNGTYTAGVTSYDDKVALTAAGVTGKNLTEFFKRWGMVLSESTEAELNGKATEDRAIWYLNDQSRRDRLNKVAGCESKTRRFRSRPRWQRRKPAKPAKRT